MASLQSEMERFEQEMKDLGADAFSAVGTSGHRASITVPPPPPAPAAGASNLVRVPSPPTRPAQPRPSAVISAAFSSAPVLHPPPPPSRPVSAPASGFPTPQVSYPPARPSSSAPSPASYFPVPFHLQRHSNQGSASQGPQYQYQSAYQPSPELFTIPHAQQQAQQLFQRDAQTITPEALENVKAALAIGDGEHKSDSKKRALPRKAAGQTWEDPTLSDWPENDYRLFCGDLGNEVNDEVLTKAFSRFGTFNMARVVRDKRTGKTKGYGFVSFANPSDLALALKEMNGKYVGNRPIKLRKSTWKERIDSEAMEKQKNTKRSKGSKKVSAH